MIFVVHIAFENRRHNPPSVRLPTEPTSEAGTNPLEDAPIEGFPTASLLGKEDYLKSGDSGVAF